MEQDRTQFAVLKLCHDSTGCDEMGDYFATEADNDRHCVVDLNKGYFNRIFFIKFSHLYVNYYFLFVCLYI